MYYNDEFRFIRVIEYLQQAPNQLQIIVSGLKLLYEYPSK